MDTEIKPKKFNPYLIIIIILILVVAVFAYNQWGKKIFPNNSENSGDNKDTTNVDTKVTADDLQIGRTDAPVTVVEYFSYLCTYCKAFEQETMPKITENYITTGKVRLILRPFPPLETGEAVLCANEQGKFLEYHNHMFANNDKLKGLDDLKTFAKSIGLDTEKFDPCLDSAKYKTQSEKWYNQGTTDFVKTNVPTDQRGTPAFFINGQPIIGAMPYENFVQVIEKALTEIK